MNARATYKNVRSGGITRRVRIEQESDVQQLDIVLAQLRAVYLQRPNAFPVPCGAVVLPMPEPSRTSWVGHSLRYFCYDAQDRQTHSFGRHYGDSIAPYWCSTEMRFDECGKEWMSEQSYYVTNDFGVLVEVPQ